MGYITDEGIKSHVENGVKFFYESPCDERGDGHEYHVNICFKCNRDFCYSCCGNTNVDQGGKYDPDFMTCPSCGHDLYEERND